MTAPDDPQFGREFAPHVLLCSHMYKHMLLTSFDQIRRLQNIRTALFQSANMPNSTDQADEGRLGTKFEPSSLVGVFQLKAYTLISYFPDDAGAGEQLMTTSPISSEMKLTLKWDLSDLDGNTAIVSGMKGPVPNRPWLGSPFQVGLRNRQGTQLLFMSTGLDRVGLKILAVSCSHPGKPSTILFRSNR